MLKRNSLLIFALPLLLAGCGQTPISSKSSSKKSTSLPDEPDTRYKWNDQTRYMNLWEEENVYNESVMLEKHGNVISGTLCFAPTHMIAVKNYFLNIDYPKTMWRIEGNKIIAEESSTMPYITEGMIAANESDLQGTKIGRYQSSKATSGYIMYTESPEIYKYTIAVSYVHRGIEWTGNWPEKKGNLLPKTYNKLQNGEDIKLTFYGDSITTGALASETQKSSSLFPSGFSYQLTFPNAITKEITRRYGSKVTMNNRAVGGTVSTNGKDNMPTWAPQDKPDLAFIGYGMNDGCGAFKVPVATYIANTKSMIDELRKANKDVEIVLCATMVASRQSDQNYMQDQYLEPLKNLAYKSGYTGIVVMDMTSYTNHLFDIGKQSYSLLGNNINHPNDFLTRQYVSVFMNTLEKED